MERKRIYLSSPTMHGEEQAFVQSAFDTNWVAPLGPNVDAFEKEMADYIGGGYAAALSAGTAAIHLAVILAGVKEGDVVFAQSLTFAASVNPACYEKAKPVFIDSEPDTWNMDPVALEKAFEKYPHPAAVIAVHLYGTPSKIDRIRDICKKHQVPLIEDAAEALGSSFKGQKLGTFGDYGAFSFNGNKIITTSGGGMIASENEEYIKHATFLATQAKEPVRHYEHKEIGYNYRMSNITAGVGRGQLLHLDEHIAKKKAIYETYKDAFKDYKQVHMNPYETCSEPNFWLSCMTIDEDSKTKPLDIIEALERENIESRPIWKPLHQQPVFKGCEFYSHYEDDKKPVSEDIFDRGLCLPSDIKNTKEDMDWIIGIIRSVLDR